MRNCITVFGLTLLSVILVTDSLSRVAANAAQIDSRITALALSCASYEINFAKAPS